jgi:hypothetical protein
MIDDQVFAVVHSFPPLLAVSVAGACRIPVRLVDFAALPAGGHRGTWSAGAGGRPDHPAGTPDPGYLGFSCQQALRDFRWEKARGLKSLRTSIGSPWRDEECRSAAVVSHISRKTSEMWGTPRFVVGTEIGPADSHADSLALILFPPLRRRLKSCPDTEQEV